MGSIPGGMHSVGPIHGLLIVPPPPGETSTAAGNTLCSNLKPLVSSRASEASQRAPVLAPANQHCPYCEVVARPTGRRVHLQKCSYLPSQPCGCY